MAETTIISWNINSIGRRFDELKRLVETYNPDFVCLQKVRNKTSSLGQFMIPRYHVFFNAQDYGDMSGVMLYIRIQEGIGQVCQLTSMPERISTHELSANGHLQVYRGDQFFLVNAYVPFANSQIEGADDFRRKWDGQFRELMVELSAELPVIICGDLNIVHSDKDTCEDKYILNRPCFSAWERQNFDTLLAEADLVDAFRALHPEENKPSFYGNFRFLGIGNRIDYFLVSRSLLKDVKDSDILTAFGTGQSAPIILTFQKQLN